jgi:alpha-ketoglutarate-dependent taurine dioxygenase
VRLVGLEPVDDHGGSSMTQAPHLRALGAALGTEVLGIDLSKPLEADTFAGIQAAFAEHPVLVFNPMHTHGFVGMKREEAWPLIDELAAHATQERFVYYHRWRVGDVLIWDERATMHRGAGDYRPDERRIMLRTIVYPN